MGRRTRTRSDAGYCGQAQGQFNLTRGFNDWDNHRDTVFDTRDHFGRNDLMMFGEHLGEPPRFGDYIDAGMRLVDSQLHGFLNGNLGQPWGNLDGLAASPAARASAPATGVLYVKSHDDDYATRPELQYACILTRAGLPNIYTDGNYQSETLGESGGAFPAACQHRLPRPVRRQPDSQPGLHPRPFARGDQDGRVGRRRRRGLRAASTSARTARMTDADGAVLFFVMNDNYSAGQYREIATVFPRGRLPLAVLQRGRQLLLHVACRSGPARSR